ncbi:MAG: nucleotidyltransferase family protein [Pyrinomonadaceae bacterium]
MKARAAADSGQLVAATLKKSWISSPQPELPLDLSQIEAVTPLLYESGAAALGWWRLRDTKFSGTSSGELLHQAFRLFALRARTHEIRIEKLARLFREKNVEVILIKGWSIARHYPQQALRPYGDIDLLVRPGDYAAAAKVLSSEELRDCFTDLHTGPFELSDRSITDVFSRSQFVPCGDEQVRVLALEDHFALLAIHLLKHGAWRPLWLCDVGLLVDTMSSEFDWELCLGKDKRRSNWILSAIGLAGALLDASINDEQIRARAHAPAWLIESVSKNWQAPFAGAHAPQKHRAPIRSYFRRPRGLLGDLGRRWPDPILSTISANGTFGHRPRLRYQIHNCVQRAARLALPGPKHA